MVMRLGNRLMVLVCFVCFLFPPVFAAEWYPLIPGAVESPAEVNLETSASGHFTATLTVPGLMTGTRIIGSDSFATLAIGDGQVTSFLGRPLLPVLRRMIEVPPGSQVQVRLQLLSPVTVRPLAGLGLPGRVVPVQPPIPKLPGAEKNLSLVIDKDFYETDQVWPADWVEMVDRVQVAGHEYAVVEIRPLRYNPAAGLLSAWTEARLIVETRGGTLCAPPGQKPASENPLTRGLALNTLTPPPSCGPQTTRGSKGSGPAEGMLVIVHDSFTSAISPFIDWKEKTGYKVVVRKTSEIADGTPTDTEVKQVIQQAYDSWTNPGLGYLLLVGDTNLVPIHWGNGGGSSQVTDNWYACLNGSDYLPDIAEARISVRTEEQANDVIDKIMTYERATFPSTGWVKKAGFIGTGDSGHIGQIEGTHDWCIDSFYKPNGYVATSWSHGYAACDRHYHTYDADTSEIAASINEGRSMVNYSGHGGNNSWSGPTSHGDYNTSDVNNNTNDGMYPFVIANACVTGSLNDSECFAETWQRAPHKGAIAYLGASNNSYWDEDDYYQRRLHTHSFPMDATPSLATVNNRAKIDLYNHYGNTGTVAYYIDMYNMLCEPSLVMWTRPPRTLDVEYDEQIPAGSTEMSITVRRSGAPAEGVLVAARKKDEGILAAAYTNASGVALLQFNPAPLNPGSMDITATGHDDRPHEGSTEVIPMNGPWLRLRSHAVSDAASGCDADGVPDIGENAAFTLTVENIGSQAAAGAWVGLDSSADVAVLATPLSTGVIPSGGQAQVTFTVRIGAGVTCQQNATFNVLMGCADCTERQDSFTQLLETDHRVETDQETFEHAGGEPANWSHAALKGSDDWRVVTTQNHTPSGQYSYFTSGQSVQKDVVLITDPLTPLGVSTFQFWSRYDLTLNKSGCLIEISSNGGSTWADVADFITEHPYTHTIGNGTEARKCWSENSGGWVRTSVDLTSFAGKTVRIRFRLGTANGTGAGWWVDDVTLNNDFVGCDVHACGIPEEIPFDQMTWEAGQTVMTWKDDVVAVSYKVWRATDCRVATNFTDVTALDGNPSDTTFSDPFAGPFACWIIQGVGPDGSGPWGHFGQ